MLVAVGGCVDALGALFGEDQPRAPFVPIGGKIALTAYLAWFSR